MKKRTFHIITFGCQMNVRDSQWLKACLEKRNFVETQPQDANVIIINTCSVREKPEQKVRAAIQRINSIKSEEAFFCMTGCVAQQMGQKLFDFSPAVRIVAGADGLAELPDQIISVFNESEEKLNLTDYKKDYLEREMDNQRLNSAFVTIMQGCDNFCSYCIVPFTKGRQKSRLKKDILDECRKRLDEGTVEIILLGQNVNAWGKDTGEASFRQLLDEIHKLPSLRRLKFVTPHPADMGEDTVSAFAELEKLCPRLHLPLQAGSDRILKLMRRRHTAKEYQELVEKLRRANPDIALSTDLITGFPGETEKDFAETLNMMRQSNFISSFSFCHSDRPGTRSSIMPDKIPSEIAHERLIRLQALQEDLTKNWLSGKVGKECEILVEGKSARGEMFWQGRDEQGDIINIPLQALPASPLIKVKILEARAHTLIGKKVD